MWSLTRSSLLELSPNWTGRRSSRQPKALDRYAQKSIAVSFPHLQNKRMTFTTHFFTVLIPMTERASESNTSLVIYPHPWSRTTKLMWNSSRKLTTSFWKSRSSMETWCVRRRDGNSRSVMASPTCCSTRTKSKQN